MTLSPLSESDSPLHGNGNSYSNPFEISSDDHNVSDLNTIIEPDDVDLSSPLAHNSIKAKAAPPKSTTINIDSQPPPVSGSIGQTTTRPFVSNTLDEPVSETLLRDLRNIAIKLRQVLNPKGRSDVLRDWDLWGPLILCLALA
ncbi:11273_t:CDS:2, partial [Diversispora eburnea]